MMSNIRQYDTKYTKQSKNNIKFERFYLLKRTDGVMYLLFRRRYSLSNGSPDAPNISAALTMEDSLMTRIFFSVESSHNPQKDFPRKSLF